MPDGALVFLAAAGAGYALGVRRAWASASAGRLVHRWQVGVFAAGLVLAAVALGPPLDAAAHRHLAAHMAQHVLLIGIAAPLLALGAPIPALVWALPSRWRPRAQGMWRAALRTQSGDRWLAWAAGAVVLQAVVTLGWHAPAVYDAALHNAPLHALEHASFLGTATLFWWTVVGAGRVSRHGAGVLATFVAALPGTVLGLGMTIATTPWYAAYVTGSRAAAVEDQQVAGALMWGVGGAVSVVAGVSLFFAWLLHNERLTPSRPAVPG